MADSHTHFNITEVEYAKKEFSVYCGVALPIKVGDTIYVHINAGVRAVKVTELTDKSSTVDVKFENLTSP